MSKANAATHHCLTAAPSESRGQSDQTRAMDIALEVTTRASKFGGSNPQQQEYLLQRLSELNADEVVPALLGIFSHAQNPESEQAIQEQTLAGYLLFRGHHPCPIPLKAALLMLLSGWNASIEEVPWYLTREFGKDTVLATISDLLASATALHDREALKSLEFWVRGFDTESQNRME